MKKLLGYLICILWLACFILSTLFLIFEIILSFVKFKIFKFKNTPFFRKRSIFTEV